MKMIDAISDELQCTGLNAHRVGRGAVAIRRGYVWVAMVDAVRVNNATVGYFGNVVGNNGEGCACFREVADLVSHLVDLVGAYGKPTGEHDALGRPVFVDSVGRRVWQPQDHVKPVGLSADQWAARRRAHGPFSC